MGWQVYGNSLDIGVFDIRGFRTARQWWLTCQYLAGPQQVTGGAESQVSGNRVVAAGPSLKIKIDQCQVLYDIVRQYNPF